MNPKRKIILEEICRNDGLTEPDAYFDSFQKKMNEMIDAAPAPAFPKSAQKRTLWLMVRPYAYLAAMFAGIFCMMQIFTITTDTEKSIRLERFPTLTATLEESEPDPEIIELSQRDILEQLIDQGYSADELFEEDSLDVAKIQPNDSSFAL